MSEGSKSRFLKPVYKRIENIKEKYFLKENSEEYQRMLAGIRVYFSLMKQKQVLNFLIGVSLILLFFVISVGYFSISKNINFISSLINGFSSSSFYIIILILVIFLINYFDNDFYLVK